MINRQISDESIKAQIEQIESNPYQKSFYRKLRRKLNAGYLAATAIVSGWVKSKKKGALGSIAAFIKGVSGMVPLIGPGVKVLGSVLKMVDKKQQRIMLERYARFAVDSNEMNGFSEAVSRETVCLDSMDYSKSNQSMLRSMLSGAAEPVAASGGHTSNTSESLDMLFDDFEEAVQEGAEEQAAELLVPDPAQKEQEKNAEKHASKVFELIAASIFSNTMSDQDINGKIQRITNLCTNHFQRHVS